MEWVPDTRILARFKELISRARKLPIIPAETDDSGNVYVAAHVDQAFAQPLVLQVRDLFAEVYGKHSEWYKQLHELTELVYSEYKVKALVELLRAAERDYQRGYHRSQRRIIVGEVFSDLLVMADQLLADGYVLPAAFLGGAVLEDYLRRLCLERHIEWKGKRGISSYNDALKAAGLYSQPMWRQIQVWGDIRNKVVHLDDIEQVTQAEVQQMLVGIRSFISPWRSRCSFWLTMRPTCAASTSTSPATWPKR